jgi:hypothetical protein
MISSAQEIIQRLAAVRGDFRTQVFDVTAVEKDGKLHLSGKVLEQADLTDLLSALSQDLPGQLVEADVRVLRRPENPILYVAANLTSLHRQPSFLAELLSQMWNGTPVEVLGEDGRWCYIRQTDGYLGWTYRPYLTADPLLPSTHLVISPLELLLTQPDPGAAILTRVLGGTALHAAGQSSGWFEVELAGGLRGWLPEACLRSMNQFPPSAAERRLQILLDATLLTGVPYLWGGSSANGIDCSGFTQLVHRWIGLTIPRDADMQCDAAQPVREPFRSGDLLFFGEQGEKRSITHVGLSLGGWRILHSSRSRNGVHVDDVQSVPHLRESFLQAATFLHE